MKLLITQTPNTEDFYKHLIEKLGQENYDFSPINLEQDASYLIPYTENKDGLIIFINNENLKKIGRNQWQTLIEKHQKGIFKIIPISIENTSWFYTPYSEQLPIFPTDKRVIEPTQLDTKLDSLILEINNYLTNNTAVSADNVETVISTDNDILSKEDIDAVQWNKPSAVSKDYRKNLRVISLFETAKNQESEKAWEKALEQYQEILNLTENKETALKASEKIAFCEDKITAKDLISKGKQAYNYGYLDTALDYFKRAYSITATESVGTVIKKIEGKQREEKLKAGKEEKQRVRLYAVLGAVVFAILVAFLVRYMSSPEPIVIETESVMDYPMVLVEGGTFTMGLEDEPEYGPAHDVTLNSFYIGQYEVTASWYDLYCQEQGLDYVKLPANSQRGKLAMTHVSWFNAAQFANWLSKREGYVAAYVIIDETVMLDENANGYRLPTEAQWEFAALGGNKSKGYLYSGGHFINDVSWFAGNADKKVHTVGQKQPNELGIYDMSGNVWEWCGDFYGEQAYESHEDTDPQGPKYGEYRVIRGGSWYTTNDYLRPKIRSMEADWTRDLDLGFRLVRYVKGIQN